MHSVAMVLDGRSSSIGFCKDVMPRRFLGEFVDCETASSEMRDREPETLETLFQVSEPSGLDRSWGNICFFQSKEFSSEVEDGSITRVPEHPGCDVNVQGKGDLSAKMHGLK